MGTTPHWVDEEWVKSCRSGEQWFLSPTTNMCMSISTYPHKPLHYVTLKLAFCWSMVNWKPTYEELRFFVHSQTPHPIWHCTFFRVTTDERFYLVPLSTSQEVLEIDRLNFELCLIGKLVYSLHCKYPPKVPLSPCKQMWTSFKPYFVQPEQLPNVPRAGFKAWYTSHYSSHRVRCAQEKYMVIPSIM